MSGEDKLQQIKDILDIKKDKTNLVKIREKYLFGKVLYLREITYLDNKEGD